MSEDRVRALAQQLWDAVYKIADPSTLDEVPEQDRAEKLQLIACEALSTSPPHIPKLRGSQAMLDVAAERRRQVEVEGWSPSHDDHHTDGSMAQAAAAYALKARSDESHENGKRIRPPYLWPDTWHPSWWKPKDRRRDLVRAAALVIAEIERLDRAAAAATSEDQP